MLNFYSWCTRALPPLLKFYLQYRVRNGKEDQQRYQERFGHSSLPRPIGNLIWIHAASVGESLSVLPLIEQMHTQEPDLHILITTGTVTAATLIAKRLPSRCLHQYIPLDVPGWVSRFLDYWRPSVAIFVESDLWPNLIQGCKQRHISLILLNARFSPSSQKHWRTFTSTARSLLSCFDLIIAQSQEVADFIAHFQHPNVVVAGNMKFAAAPLTYDLMAYRCLKSDIGDRPFWVAASTHPGEEQIAANIHKQLQTKFPQFLTIIVPRHPDRGMQIAQDLKGFSVRCRTQTPRIPAECQMYIADTLGETGLFYALAPIVFVAGSFAPGIGGHNPIEPALLECAVLWGPSVYNFKEVCQLLAPAAYPVQTPEELARAIEDLLTHPQRAIQLATAIKQIVEEQQQVLQSVSAFLRPYLHENAHAQKPALLA